jgi:uroporphyrinogen III methyltransferase / synthase
VLVTRTLEQSAALAGPLEALGAEVIAMPVIEIADPIDGAPLEQALDDLETYDWLVLTSVNAVKRLFARLSARGLVATDLLRGIKVAVVGSATASALHARGIEPDLVPTDFRAEGLIDEFREAGTGPGTRVLIPRAAEAREVLPEALVAMGAQVDAVDLYRLVPAKSDPCVVERIARGRHRRHHLRERRDCAPLREGRRVRRARPGFRVLGRDGGKCGSRHLGGDPQARLRG